MNRLNELFKRFHGLDFSLLVSEVYQTGTMAVQAFRCPSDVDLARAVNQELENWPMSIGQLDLVDAIDSIGARLVERVKGAGLRHIYKFSAATEHEPGLPVPDALRSLDTYYVAQRGTERRLVNIAERIFAV